MDDLNLVHISTTSDKAIADLINGLLKSNNIKVFIKPPHGYAAFGTKPMGMSVPFYDWLIYAPKDKAVEAKKLLEEFKKKSKKGKKGISTPIGILIILLCTIIAGGIFAWQYFLGPEEKVKELEAENEWTEPVSSEASGTEWSGTITSVDAAKEIIEAKGIATLKIFVLTDALIQDKEGNSLSFGDLKKDDIISIAGTYQMRGKMTPNWEVKIEAEKITLLGKCIKEGEELSLNLRCCPSLSLVDEKYCTNCGDDICKPPENKNNCPWDCTEIGESITIELFIDKESFDFINKTFEGKSGKKRVKILTTPSTEFYWTVEPGGEKDYVTFAEFHSRVPIIWPVTVKGILEREHVIKADEAFVVAQ